MMEMIGVYANLTATANNAAQIQVPKKGRLRGVQYSITADLDADAEACIVELSFLPIFQSTTNNTRNLLCCVALSLGLTTSGAAMNMWNGFYPLDVAVDPVQILYVNGVLNGTTDVDATFILHFQS